MSNLAIEKQKEDERRFIEQARQRSTLFPAGELSRYESPDWLIQSASLGIEVRLLLPPKQGNLFSGPQLYRFQNDVVARAKRRHDAIGREPCDVLVYFENEYNRKRDPELMARELAAFVSSHRPACDETAVLQPLDADDWPEGFSVIRITARAGDWITSASASEMMIDRDLLMAEIATKNGFVPKYRKNAPGCGIWLLLATLPSVLWSVSHGPDLSEVRFRYDFDKVILSTWEGEVIQLLRE